MPGDANRGGAGRKKVRRPPFARWSITRSQYLGRAPIPRAPGAILGRQLARRAADIVVLRRQCTYDRRPGQEHGSSAPAREIVGKPTRDQRDEILQVRIRLFRRREATSAGCR